MGLEVGNSRPGKGNGDSVRVMVVDDSAVVRGLIVRMLESEPGISVVASVGNGEMAISALERQPVDVAVLDIEMPVMDGMTALPKLLKIEPDLQVIMASTLTLRNAEISIRALEAGAADYVPKPSSAREITGTDDFKRELLEKVRGLAARRRGAAARPARPLPPSAGAPPRAPVPLYPPGPLRLSSAAIEPPDVIAIGSSTGGPQALFAVMASLKAGTVRQPILITQHMPATFTTILADHVSRVSGKECAEGKDGEVVKGGRIYVAPGDFHMVVESRGTEKVIRLNKNPPENFCRPAVDPMLRSVAAAWGRRVLVVILTGMGSDGLKGGQAVVEKGGAVIAQDEASSVVWGMPGAVANAGICSAVLPLNEIGQFVLRQASRR